MKQITSEEWKRMKKYGYASILQGQRMILHLDPKCGTTLLPVQVVFPPRKKK